MRLSVLRFPALRGKGRRTSVSLQYHSSSILRSPQIRRTVRLVLRLIQHAVRHDLGHVVAVTEAIIYAVINHRNVARLVASKIRRSQLSRFSHLTARTHVLVSCRSGSTRSAEGVCAETKCVESYSKLLVRSLVSDDMTLENGPTNRGP